jgi:hypothetical protein
VNRRVDRTEGDAIEADAVCGKLTGQRAREIFQAGLVMP